ncbi:MAG: glycosyltransferase [Candidatus Cloacimonetes bacterium]|jgi:glycosyltransferase involved in cell wall biosynthesis|nr:glycosyltransferase [Candidatus Cloacimonadota bacterium]
MISIIIRIKNEMPWFKTTLEMLDKQSRQDFELILVDSGSTDGSWELAQSTKSAKCYQIRPSEYIPGRVLNEAITHASGEYIVFNNADCIPLDEHWLENLIKPLEYDPELIAAFANQLPRAEAYPIVKKDYLRAFGNGKISAQWRHFFSLASSAVRAEIIRAHPFNNNIQYSEDIEWSWRMKQQGFVIRYAAEARVEHSHNYSLAQTRKRYLGEGRAEGYIYRELYAADPDELNFFKTVILAASAEYARDCLFLIKEKRLDWLVKAKLYRFLQRYYSWKGRREIYRKHLRIKKILISALAFDEGKSGISEYIIATTQELLKEHAVTLLIHPSDRAVFPVTHAKLRFIELPEFLKKPALSTLFHLYILPWWPGLGHYDLIFLPAGNRRLFSHYPPHTILTFHDLSQFTIPHKYDFLRMLYIKHIVGHYLHKAPLIYAISENTKHDLRRFYGIAGNRIRVNHNGYDPQRLENPAALSELKTKFGLKGKYILYVARIEHPGKNHLNLLKAYQKLPQTVKDKYELVCAGGIWNNAEQVMTFWKNMEEKERIHFPGYVNGPDLAGLYKHASLYVFPSLYEGFGIPMLEAFASGVPVVCSNTSSLPEIGKNAVLTFNPQQPKEIAKAMSSVLQSVELANQLTARAYKRLEDFSWQRHCKRLVETIKTMQESFDS